MSAVTERSAPAAETAARAPGHPSSARYKWFALGLIVVTYIFAYLDRQILGILAQPLKDDLHISDTALGFLGGTTFAIFYATLGIPVARLSDKYPRRLIMTVSLALWSGLTALTGTVSNFLQLAALRIGVAVGEAGVNPCSHSLIADYFTPRRRATAMSIYGLGIPVGIGLGMLIGGLASEHLGWRAAFLVVGVPGLVFSLIVWVFLREPMRGMSDPHRGEKADAEMSTGESLRYFFALRSLIHMVFGVALLGTAMTAGTMWNPSFLMRSYGMSIGQVGVVLAVIQCGLGGLGAIAGGLIADRLHDRGARFQLLVPVVSSAICFPMAWWAYGSVARDVSVSILLIGAITFLMNMQYGPTTSLKSRLVPIRCRGFITGITMFVTNFISALLGAQVVGIFSDALRSGFGEESLRYALAVSVCFFMAWATTHFLLATIWVKKEIARIEGPSPAGRANGQDR